MFISEMFNERSPKLFLQHVGAMCASERQLVLHTIELLCGEDGGAVECDGSWQLATVQDYLTQDIAPETSVLRRPLRYVAHAQPIVAPLER